MGNFLKIVYLILKKISTGKDMKISDKDLSQKN